MMDLNTKLVLGFLIWSAFSLILIVGERIRSRYWKHAAHVMERHAKDLQKRIDYWIKSERLWDSVPAGVIVHPNKEPLLHDADEPTLMDIMALGKLESYDDDSE